MQEAKILSPLIGELYDAAIDPTLWEPVLRKVAAFVGGHSAGVVVKDASAKSGGLAYDDNVLSPHYKRLYFEKYIMLDPCTTGQFFARIGEPISTSDIVPYEEFLKTRFYREWAQPQGFVDFIASILDKSATGAAFCGIFRHERHGIVDDAARNRMRLITPHIRRAVLIAKLIDLKSVEAANLAETLDALSAGMFLVDREGRIVHANAAGHVILDAADYLMAISGRLVAGDPEADQALRDSFSAGVPAIGVKGVAVVLAARDGTRHVAHVLPLTSGARRRVGTTLAASAALFVHKAALDTPSPPEVIAKAYQLTPTELRVLLAIVEVGGVPEVAEALGVAGETVKTHLARLYRKTGARRQAELVKLVAGFTGPVRN